MSPLPLQGILNVNKPAGVTSRDVVNVVQKLVRPAKIGHAGTLDPMAEGILLVCIGPATRLVPSLQSQRKIYRASFRLGLTSDTDDISGQLTTVCERPTISQDVLSDELQRFIGKIQQVPPKVSAVHVQGRRAYDLARTGQDFTLSAREVEIDRLDLLAFDGRDFTVEMVCSSGTYVRSVGRDLGVRLGCGAVMTSLIRLAIGEFHLNDAVPLSELNPKSLAEHLLPSLMAVRHLPKIMLSPSEIQAVRFGKQLRLPAEAVGQFCRECAIVNADDILIGIADFKPASQMLQPRIVFPA